MFIFLYLTPQYKNAMKKILFISLLLVTYYTGFSQCSGDCKNGKGTYTWSDGERYEGEFKNGKFNGKGTYYYKDGATFIGTYLNGKKHGEGVYINANGKRFEGTWENGKRVEKTNSIYKNWLVGKWEGKGYQEGGKTWHVILEYSKDNIKISYPDFPCSGKWEFDQENSKQIFFNEVIDKGDSNCKPTTRIVVQKAYDKILGVYFFQGKKQIASANLVKQ